MRTAVLCNRTISRCVILFGVFMLVLANKPEQDRLAEGLLIGYTIGYTLGILVRA